MFIVVYSSSSLFKSFRSLSFKVSVLVFQCATPATPATPQKCTQRHLWAFNAGTYASAGHVQTTWRIRREATHRLRSNESLVSFCKLVCTVSSWSHGGFMKNGFNCQHEFPHEFHACLKAAESFAFKSESFSDCGTQG